MLSDHVGAGARNRDCPFAAAEWQQARGSFGTEEEKVPRTVAGTDQHPATKSGTTCRLIL